MSVSVGKHNLITDVPGLSVGNAHSEEFATGVTVLLPDEPAIAGIDIRGGAPGTRDTSALDPTCLVETVHGIALSGGSVFGLDAAGGVTSWLAGEGKGMQFSGLRIPVVPGAILFDLTYGSNKDWGMTPPYRELGIEAAQNAGTQFDLGNVGAGYGATAGTLKGGLGSASCICDGFTIGALVAVNPVGSCINSTDGDLWARPFELNNEFGKRPSKPPLADSPDNPLADTKLATRFVSGNTTIAVVATDADLTKLQATRLAIMAADGMARAIRPVHTPFDGDTVFALSTQQKPLQGDDPNVALTMLGSLAADCLARAIGRAMVNAVAGHGWPAYAEN